MSTRRTLQASPFLQSHYLITCVTCLLTCLNFDLSRFLLNCIQYYEIVTTLMGFLLVWMFFSTVATLNMALLLILLLCYHYILFVIKLQFLLLAVNSRQLAVYDRYHTYRVHKLSAVDVMT